VWDGVLLIWLAVCDTSILVSHTVGQMVWLLQNILANIFYWKLLSRAL
jgi:hypothetical protein